MSGSWLDQKYGGAFRHYLASECESITVVGFQGRVFPRSLVRPVVLLVTRARSHQSSHPIRFVVIPHDIDISSLSISFFSKLDRDGLHTRTLTRSAFTASSSLSPHLYCSRGIDLINSSHIWSSAVSSYSDLRIGFQSFAKDFYLLSASRSTANALPHSHLRPIIRSSQDLPDKLQVSKPDVTASVFWSRSREVGGHPAERYVSRGERQAVRVRGSNRHVIGFQNAPRLVRAGRQPWFNVADELERRGGRQILLPRRVFRRYRVVANPDLVYATEDFLEVEPRAGYLYPLLVFLNSSFGELALRLASHQYGGGVFNLNPSQARSIRVPNLDFLTATSVHEITRLWSSVAGNPASMVRPKLDLGIREHLDVRDGLWRETCELLADLHSSVSRVVGQNESVPRQLDLR